MVAPILVCLAGYTFQHYLLPKGKDDGDAHRFKLFRLLLGCDECIPHLPIIMVPPIQAFRGRL